MSAGNETKPAKSLVLAVPCRTIVRHEHAADTDWHLLALLASCNSLLGLQMDRQQWSRTDGLHSHEESDRRHSEVRKEICPDNIGWS